MHNLERPYLYDMKLLQVDSSQYKIGYLLGSWIPFFVLGLLITVMVIRIWQKRNK